MTDGDWSGWLCHARDPFTKCLTLDGHLAGPCYQPSTANTKHLNNICTKSVQRRRRWVDVVQMLYKCFVFSDDHDWWSLCLYWGRSHRLHPPGKLHTGFHDTRRWANTIPSQTRIHQYNNTGSTSRVLSHQNHDLIIISSIAWLSDF